ncbi:NAD(P)-binding protein [Didymella exigua CBS 183.55]|uniref:NAD(P)-binding protein n=1 Tax=Didymella exigua CBS 183.55 TaxID=1150837 RepID=A0A6A5S4Z9_9PLEO|nr:NAD(P)-binding protein [Didymella exigua CBS 183.55]KAF1934438.1 NAD(P)-binding protein [Didymella exigua CBS 183.55]
MEKSRKSVVITGCSPNSIGEALALEFHKNDYIVCATCLPHEQLSDLEALGMICCPLDVTSDISVANFSSFLHKHFAKLDVLVNSAEDYVMPVLDLDMSELRRIFDINVFGTIRVIKAMTDLLIESKAAYNGSKAALLAMGNTLRIELSPFNVKVMTILSGPVESGLMTRATRVLPSSSLYLPVQAEFESRMSHEEHGVKTLARGQFATAVYAKVAAPPMNFWIGPWSRAVWVLETFGLQSVWARIFTRMFRLDKLRKVKL